MVKFQELRVWQISKDLAVNVYSITRGKEFSKDYGPKDQIQRAAVSIASNNAEGDESGTDKIAIRHFYITKGSAAELITQLIIASEIGYLEESYKETIINECDKISAMLSKLIIARSSFI